MSDAIVKEQRLYDALCNSLKCDESFLRGFIDAVEMLSLFYKTFFMFPDAEGIIRFSKFLYYKILILKIKIILCTCLLYSRAKLF
jgi:hypothetical protein